MFRHTDTPQRRGFTLVELLVVIGIIALLISILLPSLNRARESAKSVVCLSNMRQMGTATGMFVNDHQGWIYKAWNNGGPTQPLGDFSEGEWGYAFPRWGWDFVLGDTYLNGAKDVLKCPSDTSDLERGRQFDPGSPTFNNNPNIPADYLNDPTMQASDNFPASYRYNASNVPWPNDGAKITAIPESTQSILLNEGVPDRFHHVATWDTLTGAIGQKVVKNVPLVNRHQEDRLNYLFIDGHGAAMTWAESWKQLGEPFSYKASVAQGGASNPKMVYPTPWRTRYPTSGGSTWQDVHQYEPGYVFPKNYNGLWPENLPNTN